MISERTKKALDEKLLRIGQWRKGANSFLKPEVSLKAARLDRRRAADNEHNSKTTKFIRVLRVTQVSYLEIAHRLNRAIFKTDQGATSKLPKSFAWLTGSTIPDLGRPRF